MGLINNYHLSKNPTWAILLKEEISFAQPIRDKKTNNTYKRGYYDCFHCSDHNHWSYKCSQLSEKVGFDLIATKVKGVRVHNQVSKLIEYHEASEDRISMLVNQKAKQRQKPHFTSIYLENFST